MGRLEGSMKPSAVSDNQLSLSEIKAKCVVNGTVINVKEDVVIVLVANSLIRVKGIVKKKILMLFFLGSL